MIDAHQHFWRVDRGDYGWLTPALGADLSRLHAGRSCAAARAHGITGTILVQAAPTVAETRFLLDIARATPFVHGVVGWVDFDAADAADTIAALARRSAAGRPAPDGAGHRGRRLAAAARALAPALEAMVAHGLVFDALVLPRHLLATEDADRAPTHRPDRGRPQGRLT